MELEQQRPSHAAETMTESEVNNGNCLGKMTTKDDIIAETKKQLRLAGPLICVNVLTYSLQFISVIFVGHLGELPLAGASMATSFAAVSGFGLVMGMASALETLCGQSNGAKRYHMLGIHMQRATLVLLLVSVPIAFIWANVERILVLLHQDREISGEAGRYARFMIPSLFGYAIIQCQTRFLQAQNNVVSMTVCVGLTAILHLFICWVLVFKFGLGNIGAALANGISYWINALLLMLYIGISPSCKHTWTGFSTEAFRGISKFLALSVPSALMLTLEIWSFELVVILSGLLPNPKLETSVLSISLNTCSLVYMIPLCLSRVTSARVSNELGAGRPQIARLATYVSLSLVAIEGTFVGAIMIFGRGVWGYLYSKDEKIVKYVGQMLFLISIAHFFDGIQCVLAGTITGSGRQKVGAITNLGAYYLMGIPCAVLLAFIYHLRGKGLWIGIVVALFVQALCLSVLTMLTDWEKEVQKASARVNCDAKPANDAPL